MSEIKRNIRVALIDSGINTNVSDLHKYTKEGFGLSLNIKGQITEKTKQIRNEHGTAISLIIRYFCEEVQLIDINILDDDLTTDGRILLHAISKAIELNPDIIHLSLGTTRFRYKLRLQRLVNAARKKNITIIAAAHNYGLKCYPANLKGVILVKSNKDSSKYLKVTKGIFYAPSYIIKMPGADDLRNPNIEGTSISAAYVTGILAKRKLDSNMFLINEEGCIWLENS